MMIKKDTGKSKELLQVTAKIVWGVPIQLYDIEDRADYSEFFDVAERFFPNMKEVDQTGRELFWNDTYGIDGVSLPNSTYKIISFSKGTIQFNRDASFIALKTFSKKITRTQSSFETKLKPPTLDELVGFDKYLEIYNIDGSEYGEYLLYHFPYTREERDRLGI
jgi:hypothetical protein